MLNLDSSEETKIHGEFEIVIGPPMVATFLGACTNLRYLLQKFACQTLWATSWSPYHVNKEVQTPFDPPTDIIDAIRQISRLTSTDPS